MRVIIINPPWPGKGYGHRSQFRWPFKHKKNGQNVYPLLLSYVATILKKNGHEVSYIDSEYEKLDSEKTISRISDFNPHVVFIETCIPTWQSDQNFIEKVRNKINNAFIIVAGNYVTVYPEKCLENSQADIVIKGEMDYTTLDTIRAIEKGKDEKQLDYELKRVDGIAYKINGIIRNNTNRKPIENLDSLPFPDRQIIPLRWYISKYCMTNNCVSIQGARGCSKLCSICIYPDYFWDNKVRFRSPGNIVDEIEYLIQEFGAEEIIFEDPIFNITEKRVISICNELLRRKIKIHWYCTLFPNLCNIEMIKLMKKAGCKMVFIGVNSVNRSSIEKLYRNRNIDKEKVQKTFVLLSKYGIAVHAIFMVGLPWESEKEIMNTVNFASRNKYIDQIDFMFCICHIGSVFYNEATEKRWIDKTKIENMLYFARSAKEPIMKSQVPVGKLKKIVREAYLRFYMNPWRILRKKSFNF